ncbi:hypothetical protein RhiirA4_515082 [Rhizophagus irregularis]|uniref:RRM domain-containing protein n=1 Tax=Rhizophagus irregularis TaxID=588596 RepID=A0A2I1GE56_9GLOM|nr:hypothetical protein RhiirA4_515082 [Rhizophagus irregularis]
MSQRKGKNNNKDIKKIAQPQVIIHQKAITTNTANKIVENNEKEKILEKCEGNELVGYLLCGDDPTEEFKKMTEDKKILLEKKKAQQAFEKHDDLSIAKDLFTDNKKNLGLGETSKSSKKKHVATVVISDDEDNAETMNVENNEISEKQRGKLPEKNEDKEMKEIKDKSADEEMTDADGRQVIITIDYKLSIETTGLKMGANKIMDLINEVIKTRPNKPICTPIWNKEVTKDKQGKVIKEKTKFFVQLKFKTKEERAKFMEKEIKIMVTTSSDDTQGEQSVQEKVTLPMKILNFFEKDVEKIKNNKLEQDQRTIQVLDLPITYDNSSYKKSIIKKAFERFGEVEYLAVQRQGGLYNQAFLRFKEADVLEKYFKDARALWSHYVDKHSVKVIPKLLSDEEREIRKKYNLKLSGLAYNTAAMDIQEILSTVKAKTCKIPRIPNERYTPARYAYVSFDTEECMNKAKDYKFSQAKEREIRKKYNLKLSGLAYNTAAMDIQEILSTVKAKTCKIPRIPNERYTPARYAYVSFDTEECMNKAKDYKFSQAKGKNKPRDLYWSEPEQKICNICGNPAHEAKECDHKKELEEKKKLFKKSDKKPNSLRNYKVSYASKVKEGMNNKAKKIDNDKAQNQTTEKKIGNSEEMVNNKEYQKWREEVITQLKAEICNLKNNPSKETVQEPSAKKAKKSGDDKTNDYNKRTLVSDESSSSDNRKTTQGKSNVERPLTPIQKEANKKLDEANKKISELAKNQSSIHGMLSNLINNFYGSSNSGEYDELEEEEENY